MHTTEAREGVQPLFQRAYKSVNPEAMRWNQASRAILRVVLVVADVSSLVHLYRIARNSKGRFPLKLTPQELARSTGTLGQDAQIERNGQLGEDQDGPAQRKERRRVMALI